VTALAALVGAVAAVTIIAVNRGGGEARPSSVGKAKTVASVRPTRRTARRHPAAPATVRHVGPFAVGVMTLSATEPATPAIATARTATGQPVRTLPMRVLYPAVGLPVAGALRGARPDLGDAPFPLLVFSQGFAASVSEYGGLLESFARAGYVVAAPTYPHTDPAAPGGLAEPDIVNHPADLRFVISSMLSAAGHARGRLHGLLDPRRVAVIGHSDGGDVSLAVAANPCCRDPRLRAAVILSGAESTAFGGGYYAGGSVPLLVVQGTADTVNPPACSAQLYDAAPAPKYYLSIAGAEHQPPYLDAGPMRDMVTVAVSAFLEDYLKGESAALRALAARAQLPAGETLSSGPSAPPAPGTYCPGAP